MLIPPGESVVETKPCKSCGTSFVITDKDLEFYDKVSPVFNGKKESIPTPTLCPDCRQRRRLAFRNERKLYKRVSDLSGENIVSMYSPDKTAPVYTSAEWKSDEYDPRIYGRDFDFSRTFSEQFAELVAVTPRLPIFNKRGNENSAYSNYMGDARNCYLVFDSMGTEDCGYSLKVTFSRDCYDCDYVIRSEQCYGCTDSMRCYGLFESAYCSDCRDGGFLFDCINCSDCFFCKGLRNKRYCIKNTEYSPEEYARKKRELLANGFSQIHVEFRDFCNALPSCCLIMNGSTESLGNNLDNCNNAHDCFDSFDLDDCKYCTRLHTSKDCQDYESWGQQSSLVYESIGIGAGAHRVVFNVCGMSE